MKISDKFADFILENSRAVIILMLLLTIGLGAGIPSLTLNTSFEEFIGQDTTTERYEYVKSNFRTGPENTTTSIVILERGYHVIGYKDMVEQLRFQQRIYDNRTISRTLSKKDPPSGISYIIATVLIQKGKRPSDKIDPFESDRPSPEMMVREINASSGTTQGPGGASQDAIASTEKEAINILNKGVIGPAGGVYAYVPRYYDSKFNQRAHATAIYVYQGDDLSNQELLESQTSMRSISDQVFHESRHGKIRVYGSGIVNDELNRATWDSLLLVGPISVFFVLGVLLYAFRDPFDVLLALFGIVLVLVWMFGFMGWVGLDFNQLFISIPIFLTGLALDFGIHVIMRYREERDTSSPVDPRSVFLGGANGDNLRSPMAKAVGGVGAAFALVTLSTALGFGSSVTSPSQPIRHFGLIATFGIISAFLIFGAFVPALKIELDQLLESNGITRNNAPFGTESGFFHEALKRSVVIAGRFPWVVVTLALLASTAGLIGASTLDTTFDQSELHVEETPRWMDSLPEPFRPGDFQTRESLEFFRNNGFVYENNIAHILVTGDITSADTLYRIDRAFEDAVASNATTEFGKHDVRKIDIYSKPIRPGLTPITAMQSVAANNSSFNQTLSSADTDDDGIPDQNIKQVYDAFFASNPEAAKTVIARENGDYEALRVRLATDGTESTRFIAAEMRKSADTIDGSGVTATATGRPIIRADVQKKLFTTIIRSFVLTLVIVSIVLAIVYRKTRNRTSLGIVTVIPVVFATAWILGTMAILGIKFNLLTSLITSFTIGLGIDYSIHITERFAQERERKSSLNSALQTTIYGTGGALLGSALTSAGAFGVLTFALLKPLQQFGLISALTIIYAFIASVVVLPSLLVLWSQYFETEDSPETHTSEASLERLTRAIRNTIF